MIFIAIVISVLLFDIPSLIESAHEKNYMNFLGIWKGPTFILATAAAVLFFIPASVMVFLGSILFGAIKGFFFSMAGCLIGASCSFIFARTVGREFIKSKLSVRLQKYDDALNKHAFRAVLYLRLLQVPFAPLNFSLGLTGVSFKDFFYGTALGISFGLFVLVFMGEFLTEIFVSGNLSSLPLNKIFFNVLILISFLIFIAFTPLFIKKISSFFKIPPSNIK